MEQFADDERFFADEGGATRESDAVHGVAGSRRTGRPAALHRLRRRGAEGERWIGGAAPGALLGGHRANRRPHDDGDRSVSHRGQRARLRTRHRPHYA